MAPPRRKSHAPRRVDDTSRGADDTPPARDRVVVTDAPSPSVAPKRHPLVWPLAPVAVVVALGAAALTRGARPPSHDEAPLVAAATAPAAEASVPEAPRHHGSLVLRPRELLQPRANVSDGDCAQTTRPWLFPYLSAARVEAQLRAAGFAGATLQRLLASMRCEYNGCELDPPDALRMALPPEARGRIYRYLGRYDGAMYTSVPFRRPLRWGRWESLPTLSPAARDLLSRTTWVEAETQYFSDVAVACATLPALGDRLALFEALNRRYSVDVSVRVAPETDLEPLVRYWSAARPEGVVRELFRAAGARPEGGEVSLLQLMPPMPRRRLDTFPHPGDAPYDCFWTSLRFFDEAAERTDPPGTSGFVAELDERWRPVHPDSLRFGDMIVLYDSGEARHAMIHVADGLVFTKNGGSLVRPWIVMRADDVRNDYVFSTEVRYFRRR